jgi:uncharacterized protein (TIGR03435 family)
MKLLTAFVVTALGVMVSAQAAEFDVVSVKVIAPDRFKLAANLGRVVVDQTGLTERYDIDLKWTPEQPAASGTPPAANPDAVSIFTALQEQLGLRLNATRDKVDVLVIDSVEHPTPN